MKNVNFLHPELLITLFAGLVLLMAGCGGSRATYVASVGTASAPFVIDGSAASAASGVTINTSVAAASGVSGSVPLSTSYYKVTNLTAGDYYAVSFSAAQSDINIKVGNSAALFDGTIAATDKCENAEVSPTSEGCVARSNVDGELFVMVQNSSFTDNEFKLNVTRSSSSAATSVGRLGNASDAGTLTTFPATFSVEVNGNDTPTSGIQGSSFYRVDLNGTSGSTTPARKQVTLVSLTDNAELRIYNNANTLLASSTNAGLSSEGPLTVTTGTDGILKFEIIAKNLNPNGLRGTITITTP